MPSVTLVWTRLDGINPRAFLVARPWNPLVGFVVGRRQLTLIGPGVRVPLARLVDPDLVALARGCWETRLLQPLADRLMESPPSRAAGLWAEVAARSLARVDRIEDRIARPNARPVPV